MVKRVLKCCGVFLAIALVLIISVLPASQASAFGSGSSLPAPNPDIAALFDLRMDCTFTDSNGDYYWIYDLSLGAALSSTYNSGYSYFPVYHDDYGYDVFLICASLGDGFIDFYVEVAADITIQSVSLRNGSAFPIIYGTKVGVMDFCNPSSWSLQLVGLYPEFLDTPDGVSLEFHSHVASADFSYAGGPEAYLRLDQLAGHDDFLATNLSLSCTEPNDLGFHVYVPAGSKSTNYNLYDYLDDLEFSTDKTIVENVVVTDFPTNWTDWLGNAVSGFFELRIGPTLTLGHLLATVIGILVFVFFIKIFK